MSRSDTITSGPAGERGTLVLQRGPAGTVEFAAANAAARAALGLDAPAPGSDLRGLALPAALVEWLAGAAWRSPGGLSPDGGWLAVPSGDLLVINRVEDAPGGPVPSEDGLAAPVFENMTQGLAVLDREGRYERVNPAFARVLG
ncbi:MAG TPA: PAS domain-containing protein, partial [Deinococcales bacterium]|nr:PAS domain-containing protein [Deinococcales bacterium]